MLATRLHPKRGSTQKLPSKGGERTNRRKLFLSISLVCVTIAAAFPAVLVLRASGDCPACSFPGPPLAKFIYSAKYLCGPSATGAATGGAPNGVYQTNVNVHNPSLSRNATIFQALASEALTPGTILNPGQGRQPPPVQIDLGPDTTLQTLRSFELSCFNIPGAPKEGVSGTEGTLSIISDSSNLDVFAVYNVSPSQFSCGASGICITSGNVTSVQVLQIQPKAFE